MPCASVCLSVWLYVYVCSRVYAGFTYWKPERTASNDEKAENDNRKIVPSGRRLRSHRTMSALSVLRNGGRGMTWQMLGTPDKSTSHWMTALRMANPVPPNRKNSGEMRLLLSARNRCRYSLSRTCGRNCCGFYKNDIILISWVNEILVIFVKDCVEVDVVRG